MKYVMTWKKKQHGSMAEYEASQKRVLEIDAKGNILWEFKGPVYGARALPNGHKLIGIRRDGWHHVAELDTAGRTAWEVRCILRGGWTGWLNLLYLGFPDARPK